VTSIAADEAGFIVWDKVKPAITAACVIGSPFVPALRDRPRRGVWHYEGATRNFARGRLAQCLQERRTDVLRAHFDYR